MPVDTLGDDDNHGYDNIYVIEGDYEEIPGAEDLTAGPSSFFSLLRRYPALTMLGTMVSDILEHRFPNLDRNNFTITLRILDKQAPVSLADIALELRPRPGASADDRETLAAFLDSLAALTEEEDADEDGPECVFDLDDDWALGIESPGWLLNLLVDYTLQSNLTVLLKEGADQEIVKNDDWRTRGREALKDKWILATLPSKIYATQDELLAAAFKSARAGFTFLPAQVASTLVSSLPPHDRADVVVETTGAPAPMIWH